MSIGLVIQEKSFQSGFLQEDFRVIYNMKHIKVLHNPAAGTSDHSREILKSQLEAVGFECSYYSTKETDEEEFISDRADIMAVAGGDGTVRKLADQILNRKVIRKKPPIALLPCGTANNIGRTLNIQGTEEEIIGRWTNGNIQPFDVAELRGVNDTNFIMEGFGFGVFPKLIKKMKSMKNRSEDPEEELELALKTLHDIIVSYKGRDCELVVNGKEIFGQYLMVEIMNVQSVGPNLNIAPLASVNDGLLDVVLVSIEERDTLASYVMNRLKKGKDEVFFGTSIKAESVKVKWNGKLFHADDQLGEQKKKTEISIWARKGVLEFLV
ncbi:MAG TPA: diacylglycerol kinase family protein [Cyclobacteriaceae bacterium]|nr:diacylglycerol kinase [Cyclobacteriaceae bacterium]HMV08861.1 diacylglycerol kinase family protein [Cyclobacteriaceae bacterium]HMV89157.1 diacylglycerol kinase family protein [Cyclobacteriaceae bacterium]HMX00008.1 diacylglycerol kinase family protein [Cyclobacteriaceae bacterium]HMX49130.1 diacylglycerol kinase family protein [Cyclobacteriaceae bacterium]